MRAKSGFTLVEILIVVVILGILAAIVIPQFTDASTDAKVSNMKSDLQTVRSQIELYKIQHNDTLPTAGGLTFSNAMTQYTNVAGDTASATPADGYMGPYLQKIPTNPWNSKNSVATAATDPGSAADNGWFFNTTTGAFRADDTFDPNHMSW